MGSPHSRPRRTVLPLRGPLRHPLPTLLGTLTGQLTSSVILNKTTQDNELFLINKKSSLQHGCPQDATTSAFPVGAAGRGPHCSPHTCHLPRSVGPLLRSSATCPKCWANSGSEVPLLPAPGLYPPGRSATRCAAWQGGLRQEGPPALENLGLWRGRDWSWWAPGQEVLAPQAPWLQGPLPEALGRLRVEGPWEGGKRGAGSHGAAGGQRSY